MKQAKRTYNGNVINHYVTLTTGDLTEAWISDTPLACSNPRCQANIPMNTLFTRHTLHWFDVVWKKKRLQPFCRRCVPFYEAEED